LNCLDIISGRKDNIYIIRYRGKVCLEMRKNDDFMEKNGAVERKYPLKRQKETPAIIK
jgi:hypothetical protein